MRRLICFLAVLCLMLPLAACGTQEGSDTTPQTTTEPANEFKNNMTGEELMNELKIGWNLGNTFDAPEGETAWGNPVTTREMIEKLHELGFNTIRIPISWHKHVSEAPEYIIDEVWMKRVETVVNYALDCGMYVIINSHHDNEVYLPTPDNEEAAKIYLNAIWTQVATRFKDVDHHLIFQTMNEPRVVGSSYEWTVNTGNKDCMASVEVVNQLNQTALDAIRATGGMNAERWVIVSPYAANSQAAVLPQFRLPEDPAGKLVVSIHAYTPYNLCLNVNSPESEYRASYLNEITGFMKIANFKYVQKGIPVIIDEMGCINKDNPEARYEWAKAYVSSAKKYGMVCVWWDNGIALGEGERFGLLNRTALEVYEESKSVYQGLMDGLTEE